MNFKNIAVLSGLVVSGIALSSVFAPANASILFDSITNNTSSGIGDVIDGPFADSFSTGAIADDLTSVVLSLKKITGSSGTSTLSLFSDNSTSPGSSLMTIATIANSSLTFSLANYTYTLGTPYALSANTRYWIELSDGGTSRSRWSYTSNDSGVGVANEYYYKGGTVHPNSDGPFQMQVNVQPATVTAVPEGSNSLAIVGLGVGMLAYRIFKKKK